MGWSLAHKAAAFVVGLLFCAMGLGVAVGFAAFEAETAAMARSRAGIVALALREQAEAGLSQGLPLRRLHVLQQAIEGERAGGGDIMIYDGEGEVVFGADRGRVGTLVPTGWLEPLRAERPEPFRVRDGAAEGSGLPLLDGRGRVAGAVMVLFPVAVADGVSGAALWRLGAGQGALGAGFALLGLLGAAVAVEPLRRRLARMAAWVDVAVAGDTEGAVGDGAVRHEFGGRFGAFLDKTREARDHMADAALEVERLDRLS